MEKETQWRRLTARGFDAHARSYDERVRRQAVIGRFRRVHREFYARLFRPGSTILELGCGTGEETLSLVDLGHRVIATDPSSAMLTHVAAKLRAPEAAAAVSLHQGAGPDFIRRLLAKSEAIGGVVSALGPLNCEPDLKALASALAPFLSPGTPLLLSPMARFCPWEVLALTLKGHPREAWRRFKPGPVRVNVSGRPIPVWYRSGEDISRAFSPHFTCIHQRSLGLLLPPPYLSAHGRAPRWYDQVEKIERYIVARRPFRRWGDHLLMVFVRTREG